MARALDLEEQEQLAELKAFWKQYGNLISWVLTAALLAWAGWNFYQYWQRKQATEAAALFDAVEAAVASPDVAKIERVQADMQSRYARTALAQQASLLAAKRLFELGQTQPARAALETVVSNGQDEGYVALAHLRLAALAYESKDWAQALKHLTGEVPAAYAALYADRRGDVLLAQGDAAGARAQYRAALQAAGAAAGLRTLVGYKLSALGGDAAAPAAPAGGAAAASAAAARASS